MLGDSADIVSFARSGEVRFGMLDANTPAVTNMGVDECADNTKLHRSRMATLVMIFDTAFHVWHKSPDTVTLTSGDTLDLESVALHELGHVTLLRHSNDLDDLMYFMQLPPYYFRHIDNNALEGGLYMSDISAAPYPVPLAPCRPRMEKILPADCDDINTVTYINNSNNYKVQVYPMPAHDKVQIEVQNKKFGSTMQLCLYTALGQKIAEVRNNNVIDMANLSHGIYFVSVTINDKDIAVAKIIKL